MNRAQNSVISLISLCYPSGPGEAIQSGPLSLLCKEKNEQSGTEQQKKAEKSQLCAVINKARIGTMSEVTGTLDKGSHSFNGLRNRWVPFKGNFPYLIIDLGNSRPMEDHSTESSL